MPPSNNKYPEEKKSIWWYKDFIDRMDKAKVGIKTMQISMKYY